MGTDQHKKIKEGNIISAYDRTMVKVNIGYKNYK